MGVVRWVWSGLSGKVGVFGWECLGGSGWVGVVGWEWLGGSCLHLLRTVVWSFHSIPFDQVGQELLVEQCCIWEAA